MLAEGFTTRRGRRGALIHHDAVNHMLRGRRGARLTALTSGGTIPDTADYQVLLEPENQIVGTVNEDFAVESLAGDIFQLGNSIYRILRVERGVVRVEDAHGMPPTIPFWLGEAPGRSDELSRVGVAAARRDRGASGADDAGGERRGDWLDRRASASAEPPAQQLAEYLAAAHARARAACRRRRRIVLERFFDEAGGMQLVIHSPYRQPHQPRLGPGAAQALLPQVQFRAAGGGDRGQHRAVADHRAQFRARRGRALSAFGDASATLLIQALLDAPMFVTRWRWVAGIALALPRFRGGRKVPPQLARMEAEDLLARGVPRSDRLRREPGRRARDPRPSAGAPDHRAIA